MHFFGQCGKWIFPVEYPRQFGWWLRALHAREKVVMTKWMDTYGRTAFRGGIRGLQVSFPHTLSTVE